MLWESGLILSALGFDSDCASYPSGPAGAMLITLDNNLMLDINHILLIATEWAISSCCPHQETNPDLTWSFRPQPLISSTRYLPPSHHGSVTNQNLSLLYTAYQALNSTFPPTPPSESSLHTNMTTMQFIAEHCKVRYLCLIYPRGFIQYQDMNVDLALTQPMDIPALSNVSHST